MLAPENVRLPTRMVFGTDVIAALASVGTLSISAAGLGAGALETFSDEDAADRPVLLGPLEEVDGAFGRAMASPVIDGPSELFHALAYPSTRTRASIQIPRSSKHVPGSKKCSTCSEIARFLSA